MTERNECWDMLLEKDFIRKNPVIQSCADVRGCMVPIGLHGDAGAFSKKKSLLVLSWDSLVAQGITKQTRHVCTVVKKDELQPT